MSEVQTLDGTRSGVWQVYTETSMYIIDLDQMRGMRVPGEGLGAVDDKLVIVSDLRADNEWFMIRSIVCRVGEYMDLNVLGLRSDDWYTWRRSTIVRSIKRMDSDK